MAKNCLICKNISPPSESPIDLEREKNRYELSCNILNLVDGKEKNLYPKTGYCCKMCFEAAYQIRIFMQDIVIIRNQISDITKKIRVAQNSGIPVQLQVFEANDSNEVQRPELVVIDLPEIITTNSETESTRTIVIGNTPETVALPKQPEAQISEAQISEVIAENSTNGPMSDGEETNSSLRSANSDKEEVIIIDRGDEDESSSSDSDEEESSDESSTSDSEIIANNNNTTGEAESNNENGTNNESNNGSKMDSDSETTNNNNETETSKNMNENSSLNSNSESSSDSESSDESSSSDSESLVNLHDSNGESDSKTTNNESEKGDVNRKKLNQCDSNNESSNSTSESGTESSSDSENCNNEVKNHDDNVRNTTENIENHPKIIITDVVETLANHNSAETLFSALKAKIQQQLSTVPPLVQEKNYKQISKKRKSNDKTYVSEERRTEEIPKKRSKNELLAENRHNNGTALNKSNEEQTVTISSAQVPQIATSTSTNNQQQQSTDKTAVPKNFSAFPCRYCPHDCNSQADRLLHIKTQHPSCFIRDQLQKPGDSTHPAMPSETESLLIKITIFQCKRCGKAYCMNKSLQRHTEICQNDSSVEK